ncbi:uncharacterized protein N7459_001638 [Penicillium hispanicum]|uniref:uncharacterized protein n=1 Tax=Penicillium hispanicum TaxID=1080232 RepID=UPI0025405D62|nr:uncharacterized protein N7459_001638 [Penicillium hispanicum]KAJ5595430.1 hypothetical protein N7459_001638 [Penicillium hispanicum]
MYSTFSVNHDASPERSTTPVTTRLPKRNQVARACDWCRLNRVRCDESWPCQNCLNRGSHCIKGKQQEAPSLLAVNREMQRLRNKVKDLQNQIIKLKDEGELQTQVACETLPPSNVHGSFDYAKLTNTTERWQGFQQMGQIYYGPLSSSYFVTRITRYLSQALNQPMDNAKLEACVARFHYHPPAREVPRPQVSPVTQVDHYPESEGAEEMTRAQEEYFLTLLWQSFHCVYPVLSEPEFRQYYNSLWSSSTPDGIPTRKSSALVDVLLAVCIQYSSAFVVGGENQQRNSEGGWQAPNANLASRLYYQRAQRLLQSELESPDIIVVQSHIYSIVYLYNISLLNTAHITLGATVRIAHALRLHIRPLDGLSPERQELQRRIWWTLYRLDTQLSMTLDRPPLIQLSDVSCGLPGDDREHARLSGTVLFSNHEEISWLSFHVQCTKLTFLVQELQGAFHRKCFQLLSANKVQDIYDDPRLLETLAEFLGREMTGIHNWVQNLPQSLCSPHSRVEDAFLTNRTGPNPSLYSPLWLQRQRLLLELYYHHLLISTLRPFMRFPPMSSSMTPLTDSYNISCLNHAMTITHILNKVLSNTDLLRGWSPIFQCQWDAILCTLGFVLANPLCPSTPSARKSLQTAITTLELVSDHFVAAKNAAQVAREVNCHADGLIGRVQQGLAWQQGPRGMQSLSTTTQTSPVPSSQASFVAPGQSEAGVQLFNMMPLESLSQLPDPLGTPESLSDMMPSATSVDIVTATAAQWMHTSADIQDPWTTDL